MQLYSTKKLYQQELFLYDGKIYGIISSLSQEGAHNMCKHGISSMFNCLKSKFKKGELKWIKEIEVYMVQFLDVPVAVYVASYHIDKTGDSNDVKLRIEEVLVYVQAFKNCLLGSVKSGQIPVCKTQCKKCFDTKDICENHLQLHKTWNPDNRPCESCAQKSLNSSKPIECKRLVPLISVSDMDPAYKNTAKLLTKALKICGIVSPTHTMFMILDIT